MSCRRDEVYAAVDSGVWNSFLPVDIDLLLQVRLVLVINELHDGLPAVLVVDLVSKTWCVNDCQLHSHSLLLNIMTDGLYFDCFGDLLLGCSQHRLTADFRLEQRVHQSGLSQATLSCKQKRSQRGRQ